jgi:hypothetical protein
MAENVSTPLVGIEYDNVGLLHGEFSSRNIGKDVRLFKHSRAIYLQEHIKVRKK